MAGEGFVLGDVQNYPYLARFLRNGGLGVPDRHQIHLSALQRLQREVVVAEGQEGHLCVLSNGLDAVLLQPEGGHLIGGAADFIHRDGCATQVRGGLNGGVRQNLQLDAALVQPVNHGDVQSCLNGGEIHKVPVDNGHGAVVQAHFLGLIVGRNEVGVDALLCQVPQLVCKEGGDVAQ